MSLLSIRNFNYIGNLITQNITDPNYFFRYVLQFWTLADVEAAAQHVWRCCRDVLPLFQTDEG